MNDAKVDDMQNQILKSLERKQIDQEKRLNDLETRFAELMGRLDLLLKMGRWLIGAVALGAGMDAHGMGLI